MSLSLILAVALAAEADALPAGKPVIPPPLNRLTVGTKDDQLLSVLGVHAPSKCFLTGVRAGPWCFVPFPSEDGVGYLRPALLFKSLPATRAALEKKWGQPRKYETSWYWVNPEAKPPLRAELRDTDDPAHLNLVEYVPLEVFLGAGPKLSFESPALLGITKAALRKAYPRLKCGDAESCRLSFPPCEVGWEQAVLIDFTGDVATKVVFALPATDEVFAALEKKWGKRSPVEGETQKWVVAGRPDVQLHQVGRDVSVRISR